MASRRHYRELFDRVSLESAVLRADHDDVRLRTREPVERIEIDAGRRVAFVAPEPNVICISVDAGETYRTRL